MAPTRPKTGASKSASKRSTKSPKQGSSAKVKKSSSSVKSSAKPTQQKTKPAAVVNRKKKPPHMRYTEQELKVPQLNGIRPTGIQKPPNSKKGKTFVDDRESMNTILAMVMAEKEGNIESKMMRARQLEEVREARRVEAEKRVASKKAALEDRKQDIKANMGRRRHTGGDFSASKEAADAKPAAKKSKKRVSFG